MKKKMEKKKIVVLTMGGYVMPLNVLWSKKFSIYKNINRYVRPMITEPFVVALSRHYTWVGKEDWSWNFDSDSLWLNARKIL